ncbi:hypothetical protein GCM10020220_087240 [Nonomuraea rubra]
MHGQRTQTNARTRKGKKKTVAGKKKPGEEVVPRRGPKTSGVKAAMLPRKRRQGAPKKVRRQGEEERRSWARRHIKSTFNNTIVSITDPKGT